MQTQSGEIIFRHQIAEIQDHLPLMNSVGCQKEKKLDKKNILSIDLDARVSINKAKERAVMKIVLLCIWSDSLSASICFRVPGSLP